MQRFHTITNAGNIRVHQTRRDAVIYALEYYGNGWHLSQDSAGGWTFYVTPYPLGHPGIAEEDNEYEATFPTFESEEQAWAKFEPRAFRIEAVSNA